MHSRSQIVMSLDRIARLISNLKIFDAPGNGRDINKPLNFYRYMHQEYYES